MMKMKIRQPMCWMACGLALLGWPAWATAKLNVVATTPDLAALARELGGELAEVRSLTRPNEDPHFVEPRPGLVVVLNRADLLIENGMDLEVGWLPALLDQTRNAKIRAGRPGRIVAGRGVRALEVPSALDRSLGDVHPGGNPHYLLDPERARIAARNIAGGLAGASPDDAERFQANLRAFERRLDERLAEWEALCAICRNARVVTYHKDFSYFAERFGLNVVNTVEPRPGIAPSPAHVAALIEQMKAEKVKLILQQTWYDRRVSEMIARRTGARLLILPTQAGAVPGTESYLGLMEFIIRQIATALAEAN
jgi:zinc/manganese transport system substrate-binding protein